MGFSNPQSLFPEYLLNSMWGIIQSRIAEQVDSEEVRNWIRTLTLKDVNSDGVAVVVCNGSYIPQAYEQYQKAVEDCFASVLGQRVRLSFINQPKDAVVTKPAARRRSEKNPAGAKAEEIPLTPVVPSGAAPQYGGSGTAAPSFTFQSSNDANSGTGSSPAGVGSGGAAQPPQPQTVLDPVAPIRPAPPQAPSPSYATSGNAEPGRSPSSSYVPPVQTPPQPAAGSAVQNGASPQYYVPPFQAPPQGGGPSYSAPASSAAGTYVPPATPVNPPSTGVLDPITPVSQNAYSPSPQQPSASSYGQVQNSSAVDRGAAAESASRQPAKEEKPKHSFFRPSSSGKYDYDDEPEPEEKSNQDLIRDAISHYKEKNTSSRGLTEEERSRLPVKSSSPWAAALTVLLVVSLLFVALIATNSYINSTFQERFYTASCNTLVNSFRVLQISDLDGCAFGDNNSDLILRITELKPDLIVFTGDCLDNTGSRLSELLFLCSELTRTAPCYFVYGDNERAYGPALALQLENVGVHVLDNSHDVLYINDQKVAVYGINLNLSAEFALHTDSYAEFENEDVACRLVLCHNPILFKEVERASWCDVGFCGHTLGGKIRLVLFGALSTEESGFLPEIRDPAAMVYGLYEQDFGSFVVSSGLNNEITRINNPPELVVTEITRY